MSGTKARIGVMLPVYNCEDELRFCLDSLVAQTARDIVSLHVVAVDDGSTDSSPEILSQYAKEHPDFFTVLSTGKNVGPGAARNLALDNMRDSFDFIGAIDGDDWADVEMIEKLYKALKEDGADIALCQYRRTNYEGTETLSVYREGEVADFGRSFKESPALIQSFGASLCNKLISTKLFEGLRFPEEYVFEDLALVYRMGARANKIVKVDEILYHYRHGRPSSIMGSRDEKFLDIFKAFDFMVEGLKEDGSYEHLESELTVVAITHLLRGRMSDILRSTNKPVRREFINQAYKYLNENYPGWRRKSTSMPFINAQNKLFMRSSALMRIYAPLVALKKKYSPKPYIR